MQKIKDYAIYKGDEFLFVGTKKECIAYLGCKKKTFEFLMSPSNFKRMKDNRLLVIKLEDDEERDTLSNPEEKSESK